MEIGVLTENLARTAAKLYTQTGKRLGGKTKECARVIRGAISGADIDFSKPSLGPRSAQEAEDIAAGMRYYSISMITNESLSNAIPIVLQQEEMPIDALLIRGTTKGKNENHIIAVVPDGKHPSSYHVIDSMLDEGRLILPSLTEVTQFVSNRFDPTLRELLFVPDEDGRKELEESPAPLLETKHLRLGDRIELRVPLSLQIYKTKTQYRSRMQTPGIE